MSAQVYSKVVKWKLSFPWISDSILAAIFIKKFLNIFCDLLRILNYFVIMN